MTKEKIYLSIISSNVSTMVDKSTYIQMEQAEKCVKLTDVYFEIWNKYNNNHKQLLTENQ
jgi:hypothetical protein